MKNIFNQTVALEILNRIDKLRPDSRPQWGKMDVAQMLAHCSAFQDIAMGNTFPPRGWLGVVIGPFVKPLFFNDRPPARNMSTIPSILIAEEKVFEIKK